MHKLEYMKFDQACDCCLKNARIVIPLLKQHEWISVKDRLPEISKCVLFSDGRYIDVGFRNENNECYCMGYHLTKSPPTHWMPLPEPPENNA